MNKFGTIIFFPGSLGNHIRWLLFVDSKIVNPFGDQDLKSKLDFIKASIYNPALRSWNTWLLTESQYREKLNDQISITHDNFNWERDNRGEKQLYLVCDNELLPGHHYYHINLGLNCKTPDLAFNEISRWSAGLKILKTQQLPNKKLIFVDDLFQSKLSYSVYREITDFFEFDDNFEIAQQIHLMHHQCMQQSAKDFYKYFTSNEFKNMLNNVKLIGDEDIDN